MLLLDCWLCCVLDALGAPVYQCCLWFFSRYLFLMAQWLAHGFLNLSLWSLGLSLGIDSTLYTPRWGNVDSAGFCWCLSSAWLFWSAYWFVLSRCFLLHTFSTCPTMLQYLQTLWNAGQALCWWVSPQYSQFCISWTFLCWFFIKLTSLSVFALISFTCLFLASAALAISIVSFSSDCLLSEVSPLLNHPSAQTRFCPVAYLPRPWIHIVSQCVSVA